MDARDTLGGCQSIKRRADRVNATPGAVVAFGDYDDIGQCRLNLPTFCHDPDWRVFAVRFENGAEDHIALKLKGGAYDLHCDSVLSAIWPVLREDCLRGLTDAEQGAAVSALTWVMKRKSNAAVMVLDEQGRILESNASGDELLSAGVVLTREQDMLCCANPAETKALRQGFHECLNGGRGPKKGSDLIIFLEHKGRRGRVPVVMSRYDAPDHAEPLIVLMVPRQPGRKQIEMLAQKMGLTPAEARVAALMQLGLPNRQAAHIAGIKEQTFNTYAKRVLSKLGVSCRAEMVHMLTWQGALGRAS